MLADRQILVIDDESDRLTALSDALKEHLPGVTIQQWLPTQGEDPVHVFLSYLQEPTGLIVTDHDLTKGIVGLLGSTVTAWSQQHFVPVCNFSRKRALTLPRESNFFELRIDSDSNDSERAKHISRLFLGFQALRAHVAERDNDRLPQATLLAGAMGHLSLQDELTPYINSGGIANSSLIRNFSRTQNNHPPSTRSDFQAFILGHILVNAVLEFPGPVMSLKSLAAYCAQSAAAEDQLAELFAAAAYTGPFAEPQQYYIREVVDQCIDELSVEVPEESLAGTSAGELEVDEYNRIVVEFSLAEKFPHACDRCSGLRGGFWCPFTSRPVCNRGDCSVTSTTWIPRGASLCRVERDYFDEWAPLLGE